MATTARLALDDLSEHVRSRTDIDHIIRDIIGQYTLDHLVLQSPSSVDSAALRAVSWLKLLLDARLTAAQDAAVSDAFALSLSTLIATLLFLIDLAQLQSGTSLPAEVSWKSLILHALLSGVRLLRNYPLTDDEIGQVLVVQERASQAFATTHIDIAGAYTLPWIFLKAIANVIQRRSTANNASQQAYARTRSFVSIFIHDTPNELQETTSRVKEVVQNLFDPRSDILLNWISDYWLLFDIVVDIEQANIRASRSNDHNPADQRFLALRESVEYIFLQNRTQSPDHPLVACMKQSLAYALLIPSTIFQQHSDSRGRLSRKYTYLNNEARAAFAAPQLLGYLGLRAEELRHADGSVQKELTDIATRTKEWVWEGLQAHTDDRETDDRIYVVDCAKLHCLSSSTLSTFLGNISAGAESVEISDGTTLAKLVSRRSCPICGSGFQQARLLKPLQDISELSKRLSSSRRMSSVSTAAFLLQNSVAVPAQLATQGSESDSIHTPSRPSKDSTRKPSPCQDSTTTWNSNGSRTLGPIKFAFSAYGDDLLLWKAKHDRFTVLSMAPSSERPDMSFEIGEHDPELKLVAGGTSTYASLAKIGVRTYTIQTFSRGSDRPNATISIDNSSPPLAMAVSLNDHYAAVGFGDAVVLCDLRESPQNAVERCPAMPLAQGSSPELILNFSRDSTKLVVACRSGSGRDAQVGSYVLRLDSRQQPSPSMDFRPMPKEPSKDLGLRAAFYDEDLRRANIWAYIPNPRPDGLHQVRAAAQFQDKNKQGYLVMTDSWSANRKSSKIMANIVEIDKRGRTTSWQCGLDRRSAVSHEDLAVMAPAKEDSCYAFWMEGKRMLLVELKNGRRVRPTEVNKRFESCNL